MAFQLGVFLGHKGRRRQPITSVVWSARIPWELAMSGGEQPCEVHLRLTVHIYMHLGGETEEARNAPAAAPRGASAAPQREFRGNSELRAAALEVARWILQSPSVSAGDTVMAGADFNLPRESRGLGPSRMPPGRLSGNSEGRRTRHRRAHGPNRNRNGRQGPPNGDSRDPGGTPRADGQGAPPGVHG